MIEVSQLCCSYGDFRAVDQVSFAIGRGEIVGLLGHNGAGKSTIMKMLTGYLEPSSGQVRIDGAELQESLQQALEKIGYLPENCPLYPEMSVVAYLCYVATLRGLEGNARSEAVRYAIDRTALGDKALARIDTLSRGYRQRVGVAQAILHRPQILILDEPTNGLDPNQIAQMRGLIRELGREATVIVSTHILQEVEATCDRVLILRRGELVLDQPLAELSRGAALLLRTDAAVNELQQALAATGVTACEQLAQQAGGGTLYRLVSEKRPEEIAAQVAQRVIEGGWQLHALQQEERNLEKIFHEITAQEVSHAA